MQIKQLLVARHSDLLLTNTPEYNTFNTEKKIQIFLLLFFIIFPDNSSKTTLY